MSLEAERWSDVSLRYGAVQSSRELTIGRVLKGAAIAWPLLLGVGVYAAERPAGLWRSIAFLVYGLGSVICHQDVGRSFVLSSTQFAVCARCLGLYVGAGVAALVSTMRPISLRVESDWLVLSIAGAPAMLTLVYEWSTGVMPSNELRATTGVILGAAVMLVLLRPFAGLEPASRSDSEAGYVGAHQGRHWS